MNESQITPFVSAVRRVFDIAFQMHVETVSSLALEGASPQSDVNASIELCGDFNATLELGFPLQTAQRLVSLFTGLHAHEQTADDVADALGEIANMVAGNAKPHFGHLDIRSATPGVSFDRAPAFVARERGPIIRCISDCGEFTLRLIPPQPRPTIRTRVLVEAVPR
jgi:chemotaxis protein CheX